MKNWLDEEVELDDIYGKPTGYEWKYEVAAWIILVCFAGISLWGVL